MPDIRSLLRDAAVPPSGRPDLATIEGRATRRRRGRRLAGTALVALVAIMAVSLTLVVSDDPAERLDTVDAPGTPAVGSWSGLAGLLPASAWEGLTRFGGREAAATGLQVLGSENEEMGAVLGFGPTDFDYWVEGGNSPHEVTIGSGDFDVDAIEAAVRGDSDWSTQLEQKTHRGHPYYSWGDDYAIAGDPAPGRPLGRGGRLLATENLLVWTLGDQEMRAVIDRLVDGPLTPPRPAGQLLAMATADNEDLAGLSVVPARTSGPEAGLPAFAAEFTAGTAPDRIRVFGAVAYDGADADRARRLTEALERLRSGTAPTVPAPAQVGADELARQMADLEARGELRMRQRVTEDAFFVSFDFPESRRETGELVDDPATTFPQVLHALDR